jgi:hypothetical protein
MSTVTTMSGHRQIGLPGARHQRHGRGADPTSGQARAGAQVLCLPAALPDRDRGLCLGSSLVARTPEPGPSGEAHAAGLRQTLREAAEERHG